MFKVLAAFHMRFNCELLLPQAGSMPCKGQLSTDTRPLFADCYQWMATACYGLQTRGDLGKASWQQKEDTDGAAC